MSTNLSVIDSAAVSSTFPETFRSPLHVFDFAAAAARGAVVIDIRTQTQRDREGTLPGAWAIAPDVVEERLDPASGMHLARANDRSTEWVLVCSDGDQARRAAAILARQEVRRVRALIGGYQAIKAEGLTGAVIGAAHSVRELATVAAH
ncbi:MAG: sulfurtransferase [Rhodococcus sp.]|nr:sulfurtransferase [Rhodococcus sp. (in: high G+C Gram-positive bacteria)]